MAVRRQVVVPARGRDHDRAEGCCQARLDCCLVGADGVMAAVAGHEHAGGQRSPVSRCWYAPSFRSWM